MTETVRKIEFGDIPQISEIERECFSEIWSGESINTSLEDKRNIMLCYESNGIILGYLFADFILDEVNLNRIAVREGFRRKHVGKTLLAELYNKVCGFAASIMLEVRASNLAAQKLYESLGYTAVGMRKNFYEAPREDAVLMKKIIGESHENIGN